MQMVPEPQVPRQLSLQPPCQPSLSQHHRRLYNPRSLLPQEAVPREPQVAPEQLVLPLLGQPLGRQQPEEIEV